MVAFPGGAGESLPGVDKNKQEFKNGCAAKPQYVRTLLRKRKTLQESSGSAREEVCARVNEQESPQELRMEMDKDLEMKGAREWEPGEEERNEHLRNSSWAASVQAVRYEVTVQEEEG